MHEKTDAQTRWWMGRIPLCFLFLSFDGGDPMVPGRGIDCPVILCVCQISAGVTGRLCHHGLPSSTSAAAQLSPVAGKDRMQLCGGVLFLYGRGSIISSMRILLAALLGPFVAGDPALNSTGWVGALLLFGANAALAVRRRRQDISDISAAVKTTESNLSGD